MNCINCDEPVEPGPEIITLHIGSHFSVDKELVHTDSGDKRCGYVGHWMDTVAQIRPLRVIRDHEGEESA